jgi:hypothetical protein
VVAKVLRAGEGVQLIVFFAPIREILRKGIYGMNNQSFCAVKTKALAELL